MKRVELKRGLCMSNIFGRSAELSILEKTLSSKEAELVAIYGRRRIGKTHLVTHFYDNRAIFFKWTGIAGGKMADQLSNFPLALAEAFQIQGPIPIPKNWGEAFYSLYKEIKKIPQSKKVVVFLDELPWLSGPKPHMLQQFEFFWNQWAAHMGNVIVVLCGSAASWMIKRIIFNTKGLYGRLTKKIHLQPFTLLEASEYLTAKGITLKQREVMELYMVTGGVAKYLNFVSRGKSPAQIIQELCFTRTGFLSQEFHGLFQSLFDNHEKYVSMVRALGSKHYGMSHKELASDKQFSSGGGLKQVLDDLEASGFITKVYFYGQRSRDAKYRLTDEYTLFYLRWIEKALFQRYEPISPTYWMSMHAMQPFKSWAGYAYENLCLKHIRQIIESLKISVVAQHIAYWNHRKENEDDLPGAQIDLLIERSDRTINLLEMKFSSSAYAMNEEQARKIYSRRETFRELTGYKGTLLNTLVTPLEAQRNSSYLSAIDLEVNLKNLFTIV